MLILDLGENPLYRPSFSIFHILSPRRVLVLTMTFSTHGPLIRSKNLTNRNFSAANSSHELTSPHAAPYSARTMRQKPTRSTVSRS